MVAVGREKERKSYIPLSYCVPQFPDRVFREGVINTESTSKKKDGRYYEEKTNRDVVALKQRGVLKGNDIGRWVEMKGWTVD